MACLVALSGCAEFESLWVPVPPLFDAPTRILVVDHAGVLPLDNPNAGLLSNEGTHLSAMAFDCPSTEQLGFVPAVLGLEVPRDQEIAPPIQLLESRRTDGTFSAWTVPTSTPALPFAFGPRTPCTELEFEPLEYVIDYGPTNFALPLDEGVLAAKLSVLFTERDGHFEEVVLSTSTPSLGGVLTSASSRELWLLGADGHLAHAPLEPLVTIESRLEYEPPIPVHVPCRRSIHAALGAYPEDEPRWLLAAESSGVVARYHVSNRSWTIIDPPENPASTAADPCPRGWIGMVPMGNGEIAVAVHAGPELLIVGEESVERFPLPSFILGVRFNPVAMIPAPSIFGEKRLLLTSGNAELAVFSRLEGTFELLSFRDTEPGPLGMMGATDSGFVFWNVSAGVFQWHHGFGDCVITPADGLSSSNQLVKNRAGWLAFPTGSESRNRASMVQVTLKDRRCLPALR